MPGDGVDAGIRSASAGPPPGAALRHSLARLGLRAERDAIRIARGRPWQRRLRAHCPSNLSTLPTPGHLDPHGGGRRSATLFRRGERPIVIAGGYGTILLSGCPVWCSTWPGALRLQGQPLADADRLLRVSPDRLDSPLARASERWSHLVSVGPGLELGDRPEGWPAPAESALHAFAS